jgi:diketogulonate reductase-like aldo/keto reductase
MLDKIPEIKLNNGIILPCIKLGTYPLDRIVLFKSLVAATYYGFRSIDTASAYGNEKWLGRSLKIIPIKRRNLYITSKLNNGQQKSKKIELALETSLKAIGTDYLDLFLMHWPYPGIYIDSWMQMEDLYRKGKVKAIGVCNFHQRHLDKLLEKATIIPMINQIEIHPLMTQKALVEYCKKIGIKVEAYCPFALMNQKIVNNSILRNIASKYQRSIPQVILRWDFQLGVIPIPKSATPSRLKENISIFDFQLTEAEMDMIDSLNENYKVYEEAKYCPQED